MTSPVEFFPLHYSLMFNEGVPKGKWGFKVFNTKRSSE